MAVGLKFRLDEVGRLLIEPAGRRNCASLRLGAEGADLLCGDLAAVELPWDAYGNIRWVMDGPARDGWAITHFAAGRGDVFGIAIQVSGRFDVACHDVIAATATTRWRRLNMWVESGMHTGHRVPVLPTTTILARCRRERVTLAALAIVISRRPELRSSLSNPERMRRLAADLSSGLRLPPTTGTGARRDTVDILIAMHAAGFVHPFGRPLGGEALPKLSEIVARTRARLNANPFWKGRTVNDERIAALARSHYLDVEPWPFAALEP